MSNELDESRVKLDTHSELLLQALEPLVPSLYDSLADSVSMGDLFLKKAWVEEHA